VIGVGMGLKASLGGGEARESFLQPVPIFAQPQAYNLFAVHVLFIPDGSMAQQRLQCLYALA
jgi:hypothetical protein